MHKQNKTTVCSRITVLNLLGNCLNHNLVYFFIWMTRSKENKNKNVNIQYKEIQKSDRHTKIDKFTVDAYRF